MRYKNFKKKGMFLDEIRKIKSELMDSGLRKVILFGSRARGDNGPASDWDLLILTDTKQTFSIDFDKYAMPFVLCGIDFNESVGTHVYSIDEWETYRGNSLFYHNVTNEGIEL